MGLLGGGYAQAAASAADTARRAAERQQQIALGAATSAAGAAMGAGAAALKAGAAGSRYDRFSGVLGQGLPTPGANQASYFHDLLGYFPQAQQLSDQSAQAEQNTALGLRDQAVPGFNAGVRSAAPGIFSLMRGEVPDSVMANYQRAGGASTVGSGFGGSGFGFLNTGLFGARGSVGAMESGWGLLGSLMGTIPKISAPGAATWLTRGAITPDQLTQFQSGTRQQNIGIESKLADMPLSGDIWGDYLGAMGSTAYGAGLGAMLTGATAPAYSPYGQYGGYAAPQNGSPYGNPTPNYQGQGANGSAYYDVPVSYGSTYGDHNA